MNNPHQSDNASSDTQPYEELRVAKMKALEPAAEQAYEQIKPVLDAQRSAALRKQIDKLCRKAMRGNFVIRVGTEVYEDMLTEIEAAVQNHYKESLQRLEDNLPKYRDAYRDGSKLSAEIFGYNSAISEYNKCLSDFTKLWDNRESP